ncbi:MAG: hypothetical protein WC570_05375 [Patescibacteria group bacterium]
MDNIAPNNELNDYSGNENRPDYKTWIVLVIFLVVFLVGVVMLYFWWLSPWLNGVSQSNNNEPVVPGAAQTDEDGDGLSLKEESGLGTSDNLADSDNDGLDDDVEVRLGTNATLKDTDGDGYDDKQEIDTGHDPLQK